MSPQDRRKQLRELLLAMPPEWRAEAHGVLHGIGYVAHEQGTVDNPDSTSTSLLKVRM